jgi:predicted nucleic-acid-binding protein
MSKKILLDTNVIVRFLVRDNQEHFIKAVKIFQDIEDFHTEAYLMDFILAEVVYVLKRIYKFDKKLITHTLQQLLMYQNLFLDNKLVAYEALTIYNDKNIDFADAYLCAKRKLEDYEIVSFDRDIKKC